MIYNKMYKIKFFTDRRGSSPVYDYIKKLNLKQRSKIYKYIEFLRDREGYLDEPYSRHVAGKIRELRVDFSNNHYRILYFSFINKNIIILHAFLKKDPKMPKKELKIAMDCYNNVINNPQIYED